MHDGGLSLSFVEDFPKGRIFRTSRGWPIDQFHPLQIRTLWQAHARKGIGRISVERVQEQAIGGRVWADVPAVGRKQAVDRTNRHRVRAMTGGRAQQAAQRRRVADPTVAFTGKRVKLHCQAPTPASSGDIGNRHAAARRHGNLHVAIGKAKPMISWSGDARCNQSVLMPAQGERPASAALLHQLRGDIVGRPGQRQAECPVGLSRHQRRQAAAVLAGKQAVAAVASLRRPWSRGTPVPPGSAPGPRVRRVVDDPRHQSNRSRRRRASRGREPMLPSPAALQKRHCRSSQQPAHDVAPATS